MADLQHATLPEDKLHEAKGAAGAAADTWLKANGDGTTTFAPLPTSTFVVEDKLESTSTANQEIDAAGKEIKVAFGGAGNSAGGKISISADGNVVLNEDGVYRIDVVSHVARKATTGINNVSLAYRVNDTQAGATASLSLDSTDASYGTSFQHEHTGQFSAGDKITYHMRFNSGEAANVGLYTSALSATGWTDVPSAYIYVSKIGG